MRILLKLLIPLFISITAWCKQGNKADSLWVTYLKADNPTLKANALFDLGEIYELKNNTEGRDSLFDIAIDDIYYKTHDSALVEFYSRYFERDEVSFTDRAIEYSKNLSELAEKYTNNKWLYSAYAAKAKICLYKFDNKGTLENASEALYYAGLYDDDELKVKAMLLLGSSLEGRNKKIEAFKKYTDALYLSKNIENKELVYACYQKLASFYYLIDNRQKAKEYVTQQFKLLSEQKPFDSVEYTKLNILYATYLFDNNENQKAEQITHQVLAFAERNQYPSLKHLIFSIYRTNLINNGRFKELSELYTKKYPGELAEIQQGSPSLYHRLKAFITEANDQPDSAEYYYGLVESGISNTQDKVYVSNFYKRFGEFLLRIGKPELAQQKLEIAYQHAETAQYLPYLTEITHELDSLNYAQGQTEEAYKYAKLNLQYAKQAELVHQEEELLKLEVENEARERELMAHREAEATERKHNIQYMALSIGIVVSFILLAMIASFKIPKFVLKALGFFSFIFFFEFIIMLADHKIHHITHGEPWKFMAFKIVLIAILLPLHHWLEHKVVHYLTNHKLVDTSKISLKGFIARLTKSKAEMVKAAAEKQGVPTEKH